MAILPYGAGKALDRGEVVFDVKAFGATGDGTTNDTAAIQSALNAAYTAGGGTVFLPAATYAIDPNPGLQVKTNTIFRGTGRGSILKLINASVRNDNLVKSETWTNVTMQDFAIDGNRTAQAGTAGAYTYTQYGIYLGGTTNSLVKNVRVKSMTGVGIHIYNGASVTVESCISIDNNYHGYEFEQATGCHLSSSRGNTNLLHGVLTSPGEVSGTGSKGNTFIGNTFDSNGNYGIAMNAANANVSAWLNEGNIYIGNTVTNNAFYGVNFFMQDKHIFKGNYIALNGYFGLYAYKSSNNIIEGNTFVNNSQASNGSYDEILLEGSSSGHASINNLIAGNTFIITATNKARYVINEATSGDGPNIIYGNDIANTGTLGKLNILNTSTIQYIDNQTAQTINGAKTLTSTITANQGIAIAPNASLTGTIMGVDAPFGAAVLRMYNNNTGGNLQFVAPNGSVQNYVGGNDIMDITSAGVQINATYGFKLTNGAGVSKVLTSDASGNASWLTSTGITRSISTVTTAVTIAAVASTDYVVLIGAGGVITLPTAVGNTNQYTLKTIDTVLKTVATTSSQTIDGSTTLTITPNTSVDVVSDNTNWRIV